MEKIIVSKSDSGLIKYGYLYEYFIESDFEGKQTIINENELNDINGYSHHIRIHRIIPEPTNKGGSLYFDGIDKCFVNGIRYGGLIIRGEPCIYCTSLDGAYNFEDLPSSIYIESIKELQFKMNTNCKIKIQIWYCDGDEKYDVNELSVICLSKEIYIEDVLLEKGTIVWKSHEEHGCLNKTKHTVIKYSNFEKEIYRIPIKFDTQEEMKTAFDRLICINCSN